MYVSRRNKRLATKGRKNPLIVGLGAALIGATMLFSAGNAMAAPAEGGFSQTEQAKGGFSGPGPAISTVTQVKGMLDDARVALRGNIIQSLGDKMYIFKDATGQITVEISQKRWRGLNITPQDTVTIVGKVDKERNEFEVDVKEIIKE